MKILEINSFNFGSTGNIMLKIADAARDLHHTVITCCPKSRSNLRKCVADQILIGNRYTRNLHELFFWLTGLNGCLSVFSTLNFLKKVSVFNPDIIHLHNLHNCYINVPLLFKYIKKNKKKLVWTFHDCWPVTGKCPHFTMVNCQKWMTGCFKCPQLNVYSKSLVDNTKLMWKLKKKWFSNIDNITIVTPSVWLSNIVKNSYLKNYPIQIINNGVDLSIFHPSPSNFREKYGCMDKYIVLGVAFGWSERKGLDVFLKLAEVLENIFQIILVGTDNYVDRILPKNIISIHRTENCKDLTEIYSASDIFVNPTREENFPTVNMEALACGVPVLTYRTGGSPEILDDTCGSIVECDDFESLEKEIVRICSQKPYNKEDCVKRSKYFIMNDKIKEYMELFKLISSR